ncbi:outer membrane beta-barrel protein [Hydrogenovibrio kuenenii]|uniref:outer membrane beta-barrel protein n=1 Tax=Hydrogenovibrio kuenenii TaxID=63658 RepID=UPI000464EBD2|nr:outer membrane beta-barrel protein [Hydrogenovibrio kuenenii]
MAKTILISRFSKHLTGIAFGWILTSSFNNAYATTSFIPPLPEPPKVTAIKITAHPQKKQTAPVTTLHKRAPKVLNEYWGLSYNFLSVENPGIEATSPKVFMINVGHHLDDSLAVEASMAVPSSDQTVTWNGQSANQKVSVLFTLQLRKGFINIKGVEAYGLFGVAYSNLSTAVIQNNTLQQATRESADIAYGLGVRSRLGLSNMTGHMEYNRLLGQPQFGLSSLSLGVNYYF